MATYKIKIVMLYFNTLIPNFIISDIVTIIEWLIFKYFLTKNNSLKWLKNYFYNENILLSNLFILRIYNNFKIIGHPLIL
jgi:hypothetical protein